MSQKPKARAKRTTRVICRTTSESLRLFDTDTVSTVAATHVADNLTQSKSSFVVTNVVSSTGIDSPEDESHSEEISRITDLETPSYSEETYSKDVDDEIPLGIVVNAVDENPVPFDVLLAAKSEQSPESVSTNPFALENQRSVIEVTTVQETVIANTAATTSNEAQEREGIFVAKCNRSIGRFQVVKVESIEPFYRGRWTCHDYLDNSQHAPAEGWVFHQDRFIKKSESQFIPISPNIPDCLPTQQIPLQNQTPLELHNEAPEIVERTREAPSYLHTKTTQHFPSYVVGQAHQKLNRNFNSSARQTFRNDQTRITSPQYQSNLHRTGPDDVYLQNQYNLMSPDALERIPTKPPLTKAQSSMSTSLHGSSITNTPPPSPNCDNLMQTVELNLQIPQVQGSFLQTPPETPLSIVLQYRNSKVKMPSEPVTPMQQEVANVTQNTYFSLPTLYPITSRTYPPLLPQSDFAQSAFAHVRPTANEESYKSSRSTSRTTDTVKEIKKQLSGDEADELIAHVETYLSGTEVLDGDKDYIIMVKRSTDGITGDNVVICREVDTQMTKLRSDDGSETEEIHRDHFEGANNKGAIKKQLRISCSEPEFKESTNKEKFIKTHTEENLCRISNEAGKQSFKNNVQKCKHILPLYPLVQTSNVNSSNYRLNRLHKSKKFDKSIEEENTDSNNEKECNHKSALKGDKKDVILLNKFKLPDRKGETKKGENNCPDLSHQEECSLEENETNAVLEIVITESSSGLTPSSDEDRKSSTNESIFPEYFPVYSEWSSNDDDGNLNPEDGEGANNNICLICDISASLSFTVQVAHNSDEIER